MNEEIYYDENSWKKYFSVDLAELYSSIEGLLLLRDEKLLPELTSDSISRLISKSNIYREMLLGGFKANETEPFTENALALFYRDVLGIGLSDEDLQIVIGRLKEGVTLESATEDIYCTEIETPTLKRLRELSSKLKPVFKKLTDIVEVPKPKKYELKTSTIGVEALLDVLNAGKKLLPLYNPFSFFIISVYSVPKFYITQIYTKLFDKEVLSLLGKYGIRIVRLLEPDLPDEKIRSEREIIGLEEDCVGDLIREIILDIYSLFQDEALARFFNIEDEFNKYVKIYSGKLKESMIVDKFRDVIQIITQRAIAWHYYDPEDKCKIQNYEVYYDDYSEISGGQVIIRNSTLSYTKFFAFLAPQMFLGFAYVRPISEKKFKWRCILGWEKK